MIPFIVDIAAQDGNANLGSNMIMDVGLFRITPAKQPDRWHTLGLIAFVQQQRWPLVRWHVVDQIEHLLAMRQHQPFRQISAAVLQEFAAHAFNVVFDSLDPRGWNARRCLLTTGWLTLTECASTLFGQCFNTAPF